MKSTPRPTGAKHRRDPTHRTRAALKSVCVLNLLNASLILYVESFLCWSLSVKKRASFELVPRPGAYRKKTGRGLALQCLRSSECASGGEKKVGHNAGAKLHGLGKRDTPFTRRAYLDVQAERPGTWKRENVESFRRVRAGTRG